jgi:hypothetical protein
MTFHVFFLYPETAGRTLEEIDMVFDTDVKPWRTNVISNKFDEEVGKKVDGAKEEVDHKEVV